MENEIDQEPASTPELFGHSGANSKGSDGPANEACVSDDYGMANVSSCLELAIGALLSASLHLDRIDRCEVPLAQSTRTTKSTSTSIDDHRLYTTKEAAVLLRMSDQALRRRRCQGNAPLFRKLGSRVFYAGSDLAAFLEGSKRTSTIDPGQGER